MPAISSAQQSIMGQAWAVRTGEMKLSAVAPKYRKEVSSIAKGEMTDKELKKFASTKSKNLPHYVHDGKPSNKPVKESEDFEDEELDEKGIPMAGATSPIIASKKMPTFTPGLNPGGGIKPITPFLDPDVRKPAGKKKMKYMADYRDYILKEDETQDKLDDLSKAFKTDSVPAYVDLLKKYQEDPRVMSVLKAGLTDGRPEDEKFSVEEVPLQVKELKPTQNEIGAVESLKNICTDPYGTLDTILKGKADVGNIITYNGKYVLDGHHRWSQVYAANPEAKVDTINIIGKIDPKDILKVVHAAIAVDAGKTETTAADLKAGNLLEYGEAEVDKMVKDNLNAEARKVWADFGYDTDAKILKTIQDNVKTMLSGEKKPEDWAPKRDSMPQPGKSGSEDWEGALKKGEVNLVFPKTSDVQESAKREKMKHMSNYRDFIKGKK